MTTEKVVIKQESSAIQSADQPTSLCPANVVGGEYFESTEGNENPETRSRLWDLLYPVNSGKPMPLTSTDFIQERINYFESQFSRNSLEVSSLSPTLCLQQLMFVSICVQRDISFKVTTHECRSSSAPSFISNVRVGDGADEESHIGASSTKNESVRRAIHGALAKSKKFNVNNA